ncbi:MAG: hypothetical protein ACR2M6_02715 [Vampirovibrionia bacterium]
MDMNEIRDFLVKALLEYGCEFKLIKGKCWITSREEKHGFKFMWHDNNDIYGFKIGRRSILFGDTFQEDLKEKISELK